MWFKQSVRDDMLKLFHNFLDGHPGFQEQHANSTVPNYGVKGIQEHAQDTNLVTMEH